MFVDGDDNTIHRHFEFARRRRDNADIGLVRHQPVDIVFFKLIGTQRFINDTTECIDGDLKHFITLHMDITVTFRDLQ